jgi:hypothetical protein
VQEYLLEWLQLYYGDLAARQPFTRAVGYPPLCLSKSQDFPEFIALTNIWSLGSQTQLYWRFKTSYWRTIFGFRHSKTYTSITLFFHTENYVNLYVCGKMIPLLTCAAANKDSWVHFHYVPTTDHWFDLQVAVSPHQKKSKLKEQDWHSLIPYLPLHWDTEFFKDMYFRVGMRNTFQKLVLNWAVD